MNINAKSMGKVTNETSTMKRLITSMIFAFIIVFLIFSAVYNSGVSEEMSFLKQWAGLSAIIYFLRKFLS